MHSAGAAAGTSSSEPSCEVVRRQSRTAGEACTAAAARYLRTAQASTADGDASPAEREQLRTLTTSSERRLLQRSAVTLGSPRCSDPGDGEIARRTVQQVAPGLAGT